MSDCDCQKNIKKPINDGSTADATVSKKTIGDGLLIAIVTATAARIFFGLRAVGMRQHNVFLASTSSIHLLSLF